MAVVMAVAARDGQLCVGVWPAVATLPPRRQQRYTFIPATFSSVQCKFSAMAARDVLNHQGTRQGRGRGASGSCRRVRLRKNVGSIRKQSTRTTLEATVRKLVAVPNTRSNCKNQNRTIQRG